MNGNGPPKEIVVTWKGLVGVVLATLTIFASTGALIRVFFLPALLEDQDTRLRDMLDRRFAIRAEADTKAWQMVDSRFATLNNRLDSMGQRLDFLATKEGLNALAQRLESFDERLRHLEREKPK